MILSCLDRPLDGDGPAYVSFRQQCDGRAVTGAAITFTIANQDGYPITLISSNLHPTPTKYLQAERISEWTALDVVDALSGQPQQLFDLQETIWPYGDSPVYAWQFALGPLDADDPTRRVSVDATDGRVVERRSLADHFGDITVNVKGDKSIDDTRPPDCNTNTAEQNLSLIKVERLISDDCSAPVAEIKSTDVNGNATFTNLPPDSIFCFRAHLETLADPQFTGPFKVHDANEPVLTEEGTGSVPGILPLRFEQVDPDKMVQRINTWHWIAQSRAQLLAWDPSFPLGTTILDVQVNHPNCDARYFEDPPTIKIGNCNQTFLCQGGLFKDLHYASIVTHEYGHHVHTQAEPQNRSDPWKENIGDSFAAFVTASPVIGKDICNCESFGGLGRDVDTPDITWPSFSSGKRANGRSMSGGYWDMRESLGDPDRAGRILIHSLRKIINGVDPTVALHAVQIDDDSSIFSDGDDDLSNGSPNYEKINEAFRRHDLATDNVVYLTINWKNGVEPSDPAVVQNVVVNITVDPGLPLVQTNPAILRYRINSGAWTSVPMFKTCEECIDFTATINGTGTKPGDVIDFYVRVETTDPDRRYTCFPTQAQFVFPGEVNYTPEERTYHSLIVTNAPKLVALSTDLTTDPQWTSSPANKWVHGAPMFADFGEQPAFDYPYDSDGNPPQPDCYYTHDTQSVPQGASWKLMTEAFDLTGVQGATVSYALWFYVRTGKQFDRFIVKIGDGTAWYTLQTISPVEDPDFGWVKNVRWIHQRVKVPPGLGQFTSGRKLQFIAKRASNSTDGVVEACIDRVRVWGVYD